MIIRRRIRIMIRIRIITIIRIMIIIIGCARFACRQTKCPSLGTET